MHVTCNTCSFQFNWVYKMAVKGKLSTAPCSPLHKHSTVTYVAHTQAMHNWLMKNIPKKHVIKARNNVKHLLCCVSALLAVPGHVRHASCGLDVLGLDHGTYRSIMLFIYVVDSLKMQRNKVRLFISLFLLKTIAQN